MAFSPIEWFVTIKLSRYCFLIDNLIEVSYFTVRTWIIEPRPNTLGLSLPVSSGDSFPFF